MPKDGTGNPSGTYDEKKKTQAKKQATASAMEPLFQEEFEDLFSPSPMPQDEEKLPGEELKTLSKKQRNYKRKVRRRAEPAKFQDEFDKALSEKQEESAQKKVGSEDAFSAEAGYEAVTEDELTLKEDSGIEVKKSESEVEETAETSQKATEREAPREHHIFLGKELAQSYERQEQESGNCYGVTMAAMINHHMRLKKRTDVPTLDQYAIRAYIPKFKSREELEAFIKAIEKFAPGEEVKKKDEDADKAAAHDPKDLSGLKDGDPYKMAVEQVLLYAGLDFYEMGPQGIQKVELPEDLQESQVKHEYGSIDEIADLFLQLDSNVFVNSMKFDTRHNSPGEIKKLQDLFLDSVNDALSTGELVGLYKGAHYMTIIGLDGENVLLMDSLQFDGHQVLVVPVSDIVNSGTEFPGITWLSDKKPTEEVQRRFRELKYENGEYSTEITAESAPEAKAQGPETVVSHVDGVLVHMNDEDKKNAGIDPEIRQYVTRTIYVPKTGKTSEVDVAALKDQAAKSAVVKKQKEDAENQGAVSCSGESRGFLAMEQSKAAHSITSIETAIRKKQAEAESRAEAERKAKAEKEEKKPVEKKPVEKKTVEKKTAEKKPADKKQEKKPPAEEEEKKPAEKKTAKKTVSKNAEDSGDQKSDLQETDQKQPLQQEGPREHFVFLGRDMASRYERQEAVSNNCFAVTAAAMLNCHKVKTGKDSVPFINQYFVRAYVPEFISRDDFHDYGRLAAAAAGKDYDEEQRERDDKSKNSSYAIAIDSVLEYAGLDFYEKDSLGQKKEAGKESEVKHRRGNIIEIADLFLQMDENISVNHMRFAAAQLDPAGLEKLQELFLETLNEALSKGEAVGIFQNGHYRTIIGLEGSNVLFLDSIRYDGKQVLTEPVDHFINSQSDVAEITWISEKVEPEDLTKQYSGLEYEKGELRRTVTEDTGDEFDLELESRIAHTQGVMATKTRKEKLDLGIDPSIVDRVQRQIYVPKIGKTNKLDIDGISRAVNQSDVLAEQEADAVEQGETACQITSQSLQHDQRKTQRAIEHIAEEKEAKAQGKAVRTKAAVKAKAIVQPKETVAPKSQGFVKDIRFDVPQNLNALCGEFTNTDKKGRSEEFCALKDALQYSDDVIRQIGRGEFDFTDDNYEKLLRLYQAVSAYVSSHVSSWSKASIKRYETAVQLKDILNTVCAAALEQNNKTELQVNPNPSDAEVDFATKNVQRLQKYYRKYCARVDADLIASDEEKLRRKWDALKSCERDIRIYITAKVRDARISGKPLSDEDRFLRQEFGTLRRMMLMRDLAKNQGFAKSFDNSEAQRIRSKGQQDFEVPQEAEKESTTSMNRNEGLSDEQIRAISQVDTWVIRNIRNGGFMAFTGAVSDRADIVSRLMAMSRRKRLYVYHLIESRERLDPTPEGFIRSQTGYIPSVKQIKKKMIASPLKFYKRFTGNYIYWVKLTEAMGIADRAQPLVDSTEKYLCRINSSVPQPEPQQKEAPKNKEEALDARQREVLERMLENSLEVMQLLTENADEHIDKKRKEDNQKRIAALRTAAYNILKELALVAAEMRKAKGSSISMQGDKKTYTQTLAGDLAGIASLPKTVVSDENVQSWFELDTKAIESFTGYYSTGVGAVSLIGSVAGSIFTYLSLRENHRSMTWLDFVATGGSLFTGLVKTGRGITSIAKAFGLSTAAAANFTSAYAGVAMAGVDTAIATVRTASYFKNGYYRRKAAKLASKQTDKDKFRDGMLEFNQRYGKRQRVGAIGSVVNAGITTTAAALIAASVVTCGVSAVAGVATLGIGIGLRNYDAYKGQSQKMALFDHFFDTEERFNHAKAQWERKHPGTQMTDQQMMMLIDQIRRRIAADLGFCSPSQATRAIAKSYAKYLLTNAHYETEKGPMCVAMIRGLGLRYKYDFRWPMDAIPQESDIVKKLCN